MKNNSIQIISGKLKRRKISFPGIDGLRPTSNLIRETIFNWLQNYIYNSICLDAFAGSGALGIEAISQGANHTIFNEKNNKAISSIKKNISTLGITNYKLQNIDSLIYFERLNNLDIKEDFIIFLDPPYDSDLAEKSITLINRNENIKIDTLIYLEKSKQKDIDFGNLKILKEKSTKSISYYLLKK